MVCLFKDFCDKKQYQGVDLLQIISKRSEMILCDHDTMKTELTRMRCAFVPVDKAGASQ